MRYNCLETLTLRQGPALQGPKNRKKKFSINQPEIYSRICPQSCRGQFEVFKEIQGRT